MRLLQWPFFPLFVFHIKPTVQSYGPRGEEILFSSSIVNTKYGQDWCLFPILVIVLSKLQISTYNVESTATPPTTSTLTATTPPSRFYLIPSPLAAGRGGRVLYVYMYVCMHVCMYAQKISTKLFLNKVLNKKLLKKIL